MALTGKGSITFEDYLRSFDVTSDLRLQFNRMVEDICDHASLDREERWLITMMLLKGFKGKEIAAELGMTPSAVSQKYRNLSQLLPLKNLLRKMVFMEVAGEDIQGLSAPKHAIHYTTGIQPVIEDQDRMLHFEHKAAMKDVGQQVRAHVRYVTY